MSALVGDVLGHPCHLRIGLRLALRALRGLNTDALSVTVLDSRRALGQMESPKLSPSWYTMLIACPPTICSLVRHLPLTVVAYGFLHPNFKCPEFTDNVMHDHVCFSMLGFA